MAESTVMDDIRRALGHAASTLPEPLPPFSESITPANAETRLARFVDEARAVRAQVQVVPDKEDLVHRISEICGAHQGEMALSAGGILSEVNLAQALSARGHRTMLTSRSGYQHEEMVTRLANCSVGITVADYAIAETGTIVLSSDEKHALLVSLLPPVHIAVLRAAQIMTGLEEVIESLNQERIGRDDPCHSASFITGPSRTSDVELTLSIGVHGPKELHVIILN